MACIAWIGTPYRTNKSYKYYKAVSIDGDIYKINDTVLAKCGRPKNPFVAKIIQLFSNSKIRVDIFYEKQMVF